MIQRTIIFLLNFIGQRPFYGENPSILTAVETNPTPLSAIVVYFFRFEVNTLNSTNFKLNMNNQSSDIPLKVTINKEYNKFNIWNFRHQIK